MKFKMSFEVPTKDLKDSTFIDLPVSIHGIVDGKAYNDLEYSVMIPNFIFDELADTEPKFKTKYDQNNREICGLFSDRTLTQKFKKTQTAKLPSLLKDLFRTLTKSITDKHRIETTSMKKKLFIRFEHHVHHTTNNWCGSYRGQRISQNYNYFVGYEVTTKAFNGINDEGATKKYITKIEYHSPYSSLRKNDTGFEEVDGLFLPLHSHGESIKAFEENFSIVDWTQERQDFLERIKNTFISMNNDLSNFLKDIDSDKMDLLISGGNEIKFLQ